MERPRCQQYPLYMLSISYVYTSYLVYHLLFLFCTDLWRDQLPLLLLRSFLNHIFHNQHLALELPQCLKLFPVQISLWKTSSFWMLVFRNYFSQYFFSMILFLRLTHIDGERTTSVTISVDRRSSAPVSSWTSTNTGPSISAWSTKSLLVSFRVSTWIFSTGSSGRLFYSSPCSSETTFAKSSLLNMKVRCFNPTFIGWPSIASYGELLMPSC